MGVFKNYIVIIKSTNHENDSVLTARYTDERFLEEDINNLLKKIGVDKFEGYEYMEVNGTNFIDNDYSVVIGTWVGAGTIK